MKTKSLVIIFTLSLISVKMNAQWVLQALGYETEDKITVAIEAFDHDRVWTCANTDYEKPYHRMARTIDGGDSWITSSVPGYPNAKVKSMSALNMDTAWILLVDTINHLVKTTNGGQTWIEQYLLPQGSPSMSRVHFWDKEDGVVIGFKSGDCFGVYRTFDGGSSWAQIECQNFPVLLTPNEDIIGYPPCYADDNIWMMTTEDRILRSSDRGQHWTAINHLLSFTNHNYVSFQNQSHGMVWRTGPGVPKLCETWNGGLSWSVVDAPGLDYSQVAWIPETFNTLIGICGVNSGAGYSLDGGLTWTAWDTFTAPNATYSTAWVDNTCGWIGSTTFNPEPWTKGIWKFTGSFNSVLELDIREGGAAIYPVPCSGLINMVVAGFKGKDVMVEFHDIQGRLVYTDAFRQHLTQDAREYDLSHLPPGIYIAHIQCDYKSIMRKIIIEY